MRTTIDIPDELFKKMKTQVVQNETTIKSFILNLLNREFNLKNPDTESKDLQRNKFGLRERNFGLRFKNKEIDKLREDLAI